MDPNLDPAMIFRETLFEESGGQEKTEADLRMAYAEKMAERIQIKISAIETGDLDFDALFDCAVSAARPVKLKTENGKEFAFWYAAAVDIPVMVNQACPSLSADERQTVALTLAEKALTGGEADLETSDGVTLTCGKLATVTKKNAAHDVLKRFFASLMIATTAYLSAAFSAEAETLLGTRQVSLSTMATTKMYDKMISGKDDPVFDSNRGIKAQMRFFASKKGVEQIRAVHRFWNAFSYKSDIELYGKSDHWATPSEFVRKKGGDCEDFALIKYWTLRKLGIPAQRMRIMVGTVPGRDGSHAVLSVADEKGQVWILDNLQKNPVPEDKMVTQFVPLLSVNEDQRIVHCALPDLKTAMLKRRRAIDREAPPPPPAFGGSRGVSP